MSAESASPAPQTRVRVWDLPTRVFHWLLALTVLALVVTAKMGGNAMEWHTRLGLLALALLAFRVVWGVFGGLWSRFGSFLYTPRAVLEYLRGHTGPQGRYDVGHSPLGALSVWALLVLLAVQVATGLVADDEVGTTGPLNRFVSSALAGRASAWHTHWGQWLLLALIALHVAAVLFYGWRKRRNLIMPMLSGDKWLSASTPASADGVRQRVIALVVGALCLAGAWWVGRGGG